MTIDISNLYIELLDLEGVAGVITLAELVTSAVRWEIGNCGVVVEVADGTSTVDLFADALIGPLPCTCGFCKKPTLRDGPKGLMCRTFGCIGSKHPMLWAPAVCDQFGNELDAETAYYAIAFAFNEWGELQKRLQAAADEALRLANQGAATLAAAWTVHQPAQRAA
jgi:hypothetical protein